MRGTFSLLMSAVVAAGELYCPTEEDFATDGDVSMSASGWTMTGGGGVHGKQTFNLIGGYVEFDIDTTAAQGGVNNNFYLVFPDSSYFSAINDCDIQGDGKPFCMEMDIIENNGNCLAQTTWHTWPNYNGGCDRNGCWGQTQRSGVTRVRTEFADDGTMTVYMDGSKVSVTNPVPSSEAVAYVNQTMVHNGAQIQSSQWVGWVPTADSCSTSSGDLSTSAFTISNITISGTVVQGSAPALCSSSSSSSPTTTLITGSTTTLAPTSTPTVSDCSTLHAQCGGINWDGPTCCETGTTCTWQNDYYEQCLALNASETCIASYGQCGGQGWTGKTTCCIDSQECVVLNAYHSQCEPSSRRLLVV